MKIEVKDEQVILFENKNKQNNQPDYKGMAKFNGIEMEVSIWIKEGQNGKYLSGKLQKPYIKQNENQSNQTQNQNEDIPF